MAERQKSGWVGVVLLCGLLAGAAGAGVYLADRLYYRPLREQARMIDNLKTMVDRLTKQTRVAQVIVVDQTQNPLRTKLRFVEVDEKNEKKIGTEKEFWIDGDVAYIDTLVIEFKGSYDPQNDLPLRNEKLDEALTGKSIIFFRRIFSEKQKPEDGLRLDASGEAPAVYKGAGGPEDALEKQLWAEFWELANNPERAEKRGVRAAFGNATYIKFLKGRYYVVERRVNGPPTLRVETPPAVYR
jgi:hypothetical protein